MRFISLSCYYSIIVLEDESSRGEEKEPDFNQQVKLIFSEMSPFT